MFLTRLTSSLTQLTRTDISASLKMGDGLFALSTEDGVFLLTEDEKYIGVLETNVIPVSTEDGSILKTENGNYIGVLA